MACGNMENHMDHHEQEISESFCAVSSHPILKLTRDSAYVQKASYLDSCLDQCV